MLKIKLTLLIILIILFTLGLYLNYKLYNSNATIEFTNQPPITNTINKKFIYISGEVTNPGIYEFVDGMRISDVIEISGGVTENADSNYINKDLNLAEKLKDEQKIFIPSKVQTLVESTNSPSNDTEGLINLNTASLDELDSLPGIGPSTAEKIIDARPFNTIESLLDVSGFGESKYNEVKDLITI
jgi:competence protein ComEA